LLLRFIKVIIFIMLQIILAIIIAYILISLIGTGFYTGAIKIFFFIILGLVILFLLAQ